MEIKYLIIHHEGVDSKNTSLATMKSWPYTKVISKGGRIVNGQDTWHTYGYNHNGLAVCLDGQFEIEEPTDKQIDALVKVLRNWKKKYPEAKIVGHRDLRFIENGKVRNATACPGKNLYKRIPEIKTKVERKERDVKLYRKKGKNTVWLKAWKYGFPIASEKAFNKWFGKDAWDYVKEVDELPFSTKRYEKWDIKISTPYKLIRQLANERKMFEELKDNADKNAKRLESQQDTIESQEDRIKDQGKEIKTLRKRLKGSSQEKPIDKPSIWTRLVKYIKNLINKE